MTSVLGRALVVASDATNGGMTCALVPETSECEPVVMDQIPVNATEVSAMRTESAVTKCPRPSEEPRRLGITSARIFKAGASRRISTQTINEPLQKVPTLP